MMSNEEIVGCITFIQDAEKLKDTLRSSHTSTGRRESTTDHTWRLCLMAIVFEREFDSIDLGKLLRICVIHDLGEALNGDIPAVDQLADLSKTNRERDDLISLLRPLDKIRRMELLSLWQEYDSASSPEAVIAKGLDKLETIIQHNQGINPIDFDYEFNLTYGTEYTSENPLFVAIRRLVDDATRRRILDRDRKS